MSDRLSQVSHLVSSVERAEAELAGRLAFEFKAPSKGFDTSKVVLLCWWFDDHADGLVVVMRWSCCSP